MDKNKFFKNVITGFGGQLIVMILGIIVPRIMINNYGSDVNGLLSTMGQIFTYVALFEAGIAQAAKDALFKPLVDKDTQKISYVSSVASNCFKRITVFYALAVVVLALLSPIIIKTEVPKLTVVLVVFFEGLSGVVGFHFTEARLAVLRADGRGYVSSILNVFVTTTIYIVKIIMAAFLVNVAVLQFVYLLIAVAKVIFFKWYFKKHYDWLDFNAAPKTAQLPNRKSYVLAEIAGVVTYSTDMIVLAIFVSAAWSSVYSIYNFVYVSLAGILNSVYFSLVYMLGKAFHKDKKQYAVLHDGFTSFFYGAMTIFMCTAYILILPFVRLYTSGVTDVEYVQPMLPLMFCLIYILTWSTYVTGNLSSLAGYVKQKSIMAVSEAALNVILSVALVGKYGIVGVAFATVVSIPIKVVYLTWLAEKKILKRSPIRYLGIMFSNYLLFGLTVFVNQHLRLSINNFFDFVVYGALVFACCAVAGIVVNVAVNRDCITIAKMLLHRKSSKES